ncbi:hypothetical protein LX32DRAFT_668932 [Colletotrichum zoysiae]|uniref:Transposase Tc1-like domain-containing protein n=1 Tax=Colletotrichum zoysiae TaxID=1216348 RepID=A0AAD9H1Z2_9PEZI|nr:hypothetical protein LX32DRAFT_668932 [Colletotrichum zoysiae]
MAYSTRSSAVFLALRSRQIGKTADETADILGLTKSTVNRIVARAKKHGFDPSAPSFILLPKYINDAPRTSRPKKATPSIADLVIQKVCRNRYSREKTYISASTVYRILQQTGFRKTKPTRKPGLLNRIKQERLS